MKRILIVSEAHLINIFLLPIIKQLNKETDVVFDCLIIAPSDLKVLQHLQEAFKHIYVNSYPMGFIKRIPKIRFFHSLYGLIKLVRSLPEYDITHIHFHHYYLAFCSSIFRKKTKKFYVTFFGSDFNQVGQFQHIANRYTIKLSDGVFATNYTLLEAIIKKYNLSNNYISKDILIPLMESFRNFRNFLMNNTSDIAKENLKINKSLIVCGYSAARISRHDRIIEALVTIEDKISDFKAIFPMAYGSEAEDTRTIVKNILSNTSIDYIVLEEFILGERLLNLRLAADVFIHIQARDQMSSSMLEHLAAGTVVITGKWLPYDSLIEKGVYFIRINSPDDLAKTLEEVIDSLDIHKRLSEVNREIILKMMSWENIRVNWYKYYELNLKA